MSYEAWRANYARQVMNSADRPRPFIGYEDRSMRVPRGSVVSSAWIPIDRIRFACRDPMSDAAVSAARDRLLRNRDEDGMPYGSWPCPIGEWDGDTFVIQDGRHEKLARMMMGDHEILVAWLEPRRGAEGE